MNDRATHVIRNAKNLGVPAFIRPRDIARGNKNLNLAFCAQVHNTRNFHLHNLYSSHLFRSSTQIMASL